MITNYSDPIVTLNQVYREGQDGSTPQLGACIIGPNYNIYSYDILGQDNRENIRLHSDSSIFSSDASIIRSFSFKEQTNGYLICDSVKIFVKDAQISLKEFDKSTYTITINPATTSVTSGLGNDVLSFFQGETAVDLKTHGIQKGTTLELNVTYKSDPNNQVLKKKAVVTKLLANKDGIYCYCIINMILKDAVIESITAIKTVDGYMTDSSFTLHSDEDCKNSLVNQKGLASSENIAYIKFTKPKIKSTFTGTECIYTVLSGACYVQYKAQSLSWQHAYGMVSKASLIEDLLGPICPQNPLAMAVAAAVSQADGNLVYFIALPQEALIDTADTETTIQAYKEAIGLTQNKDNLYGIVPCTTNTKVLKALNTYLQNLEKQDIPILKYLYTAIDIQDEYLMQPSDAQKGELTLSAVPSGNTLTFLNSPLFYYDRLQNGDIVQIGNGYRFIINTNNGKDSISLKDTIPSDLEITTQATVSLIHKVKDNDQLVQRLVQKKPITSRRGSVIFADTPVFNNLYVAPYIVAAAIAGRRSASYPHAPLSNIKMKSVITEDKRGFTRAQLDLLGANGFWRIGLNTEGQTISRRQLTSAAASDVNKDQQSIICNIDSICMTLKNTGKDIVGNTNISPALLEILQTTMRAKLSGFQVYVDQYIGPQLLSSNLISIKQDQVFKDRIYAQMEGQPPKPFNRFHMTFYVN